MAGRDNNLRSAIIPGSSFSENDHTISWSDFTTLMMKKFEDVTSVVQEVKGRMMNLEDGMGRLLIATKSNMDEFKAPRTGPRCLKLVFRNKISLPVLNGQEIKGEGGKYLEVALVDDVTGTVVDFGQEASAQVAIVALEGDSHHAETDTWVIGNYKNINGSTESEEKRSVLVGQVKLKLNKGICSLVNVKFKTSSNHNSGVFKLGAKVLDSFHGTLIKEAMTEPFAVKDFRKKYKQKHHPPSLSDEIWRLENIQKSGPIYKRVKEKVKTVEDFLIHLLKDPAALKCLFHLPEKTWEATVNHARTCTINQRVYCSINSQQNKGIVFNVVGKTLGLIKDMNYVQDDKLSEEDKVEARKLLSVGLKEEMKDFDDEGSLLQFLSTVVPTNYPRPENTARHEVETSKIGESDQLKLMCKHPDRDIIVSQEPEATALDRVNLQDVFPIDSPTACRGLEAPPQGPILINQANNNVSNAHDMNLLIAPSQEHSVHNGLDFQDIFPSASPTAAVGGTTTGLLFDSPLYSPYNDQPKDLDAFLKDILLSSSPSRVDGVEASEGDGFDQRGMDMETNLDCFLNPQYGKYYPPIGPLWSESIQDQYDPGIPSSSFSSLINDKNDYWFTQVHAGKSYSDDNGNQWLSKGGSFMDCLTHASYKSWNILLWVIKWCFKIKKSALAYRLKKKRRI